MGAVVKQRNWSAVVVVPWWQTVAARWWCVVDTGIGVVVAGVLVVNGTFVHGLDVERADDGVG